MTAAADEAANEYAAVVAEEAFRLARVIDDRLLKVIGAE